MMNKKLIEELKNEMYYVDICNKFYNEKEDKYIYEKPIFFNIEVLDDKTDKVLFNISRLEINNLWMIEGKLNLVTSCDAIETENYIDIFFTVWK
jgi:hypothetical protein